MSIPSNKMPFEGREYLMKCICYDLEKNTNVTGFVQEIEDKLDTKHKTINIWINGQLVGSSSIRFKKNSLETENILYVEIMRSDKSEHYKYIGQALHDAHIYISLREKVENIQLSTAWKSHAFHIKCGFELIYNPKEIRKSWKTIIYGQLKETAENPKESENLIEFDSDGWEIQKKPTTKKVEYEPMSEKEQKRKEIALTYNSQLVALQNKILTNPSDSKSKEEYLSILEKILEIPKDQIKFDKYFPIKFSLMEKILNVAKKHNNDTTRFGGLSMVLSNEALIKYKSKFKKLNLLIDS